MAPCEILLDGLSGKEHCARRRNLEEDCSGSAASLVDLNPYMKKSSLESALQLMDQENKGMLSKGVLPAGLWAKREAYALKELLMKNLKTAHNFRHREHDKARDDTTFLPPLLMATLANQAPPTLVLVSPVFTRGACSLLSFLANPKPHWEPQW